MKKVFPIFLLLLIVSFFKPVYAQFPLEVSNRWDYTSSWWDPSGGSSSDTVVYNLVSDTLLENGKLYYLIRPLNYYFFNEFMRADSIGIYYYYNNCSKEWLFFDYTLAIGEYVEVPYNSYAYCDTVNMANVYKILDTTTVFFGDSVRFMKFYYSTGLDDEYTVGIIPNFGFVEWNTSDFFGYYSMNLFGAQLSGVVYGILTNVDEENPMPYKYSLHQNYPNPFNPSTIIEYEIPEVSFVTVKVYDVLGNEVITLVNEEKPAGNHRIQFDGSQLSSGIYFYQLTAGTFVQNKKMILLR